jgi:hypothetical protein
VWMAAGWALLSLIQDQGLPIGAALIQWLLTVCCYPVMHLAFVQVHTMISRKRWRIAHGR